MTPRERTLIAHEGNPSPLLEEGRAYHSTAILATQPIKELRLLQEHIAVLETEICQIVEQSREGQILISIPGFGPLAAATVIAVIGTIANFESAAAFKSYLGWAPKRAQSGTSFDRSSLAATGVRPTKQILYLVVWELFGKRTVSGLVSTSVCFHGYAPMMKLHKPTKGRSE